MFSQRRTFFTACKVSYSPVTVGGWYKEGLKGNLWFPLYK